MPPETDGAFARLQRQLHSIWTSVREDDTFSHTSVILPSLSVDQEELSKVQGASFYEERPRVLQRTRDWISEHGPT